MPTLIAILQGRTLKYLGFQKGPTLLLLIFSILYLVFSSCRPALAIDNPATGSAAVTATVPEFTLTKPDVVTLISPANNSVINTTAPTFIFNPSNSAVTVDHYQLFIDGNLALDNIPQSTNTIMVNAPQALKEGTHVWRVNTLGYNNTSHDSATWSFTIDTTAPPIIITEVADQPTNLTSLDLTVFPYNLIFKTEQKQPKIIGQSESNNQITISLSNLGNSLTLSGLTDSTGRFSLFPDRLLTPGNYLTIVSASDPAGNTTTLPSFIIEVITPTGLVITLPSPLPAIKLPNLPQLFPKTPEAFIAFTSRLTCTCYPFIWIVIFVLILYIFYLHYQNRSKKNKSIS